MSDSERNESVVRFRYVGIKINKLEIPGICLTYSDRPTAKRMFKVIQRYITSPAERRSMSVVFSTDRQGRFVLEIGVMFAGTSLNTSVSGIDPALVKQLVAALRHVTYYVILAGYEVDGNFELLPPKAFHLFRSSLVVDGALIEGVPNTAVDWDRIFE